MSEKVSIAACNGMSALGLISRATSNDLATENDNIVSICITAAAAGNNDFNEMIEKYPVFSINGCSDSCVDKILKSKGISVKKSFNIDELLEKNSLKSVDPSRLDVNGEKSVVKLKSIIMKELD